MTVTDFLLARIAEDEAWVVTAECGCGDGWPQRPDCPDRVANECEVKRRILAGLNAFDSRVNPGLLHNVGGPLARLILHDLAAVYSDHPDYREEWRP